MTTLRTYLFIALLRTSLTLTPKEEFFNQIGNLYLNSDKFFSTPDKVLFKSQVCNAIDEIKKIAKSLISAIQSGMPNGIEELRIPPMEPLRIPKFSFHTEQNHYSLKGDLKDILIRNLSSFNLTDLDTSIPRKTDITAHLHIPTVTVEGSYEMQGEFFKMIPVYTVGLFHTTYKNVTIRFHVELAVAKEDGSLSIKDLNCQTKVGRLEVDFGRLFGRDGYRMMARTSQMGKLINDAMNAFSKEIFKMFEPSVRKEVNRLLTKQINWMIKDIKMPPILRITSSDITCPKSY